jgi:hypothetical protein
MINWLYIYGRDRIYLWHPFHYYYFVRFISLIWRKMSKLEPTSNKIFESNESQIYLLFDEKWVNLNPQVTRYLMVMKEALALLSAFDCYSTYCSWQSIMGFQISNKVKLSIGISNCPCTPHPQRSTFHRSWYIRRPYCLFLVCMDIYISVCICLCLCSSTSYGYWICN